MPSSRGSSPLSSATPSPDPQYAGLPLQSSTAGPSHTADRDDRSQTSSTVLLSNLSDNDSDEESDLTEEDEGVHEESSKPHDAIGSMRKIKEETPKAEEEEEDEVMDDLSDIPIRTTTPDRTRSQRPPKSIGRSHGQSNMDVKSEDMNSEDESIPSSPSLTPPPPSVKHQSSDLPVIGSIRPPLDQSDDDDLSEPDEEASENDNEEEGDDLEEQGEQDDAEEERDEGDAEHGADAEEHDGGDATENHEAQDEPMDAIGDDAADGIEAHDEAVEEEEVEHPEVDIQVEAPEEDMSEAGDAEPEVADTTVQQPARHHPSHAPPPSQAHMRELFRLELKFAALRDQLYVERMEEVAAEEQMILDGTHPALQYLYKSLADRRERLHEVASRRHKEAKEELKRARDSDKNHTWSWWTEQRDQLHWEEFEATWSKRRRLAREKNEIETPRTVKPVPRAGGRIRNFDWSAGAAPMKMSLDDASADLAVMENRPIAPAPMIHMSRHASPVVYAPPAVQPIYATAAPIAGPSQAPIQANGVSGHQAPAQAQQPAQSFAYNPSNHISYNIPRTTQSAQPAPVPAARPPAPSRPQGRTVPTTSDLFESGRKDPTSHSWKADPMRPANGLAKDALGLSTNPTQAGLPPKAEERPVSRFPGLSEYLNSTNPRPSGVSGTAGGYGGMGNSASKILSPPKTTTTTTSLLGSFGRPGGPFVAAPSASATTAGTTTNRP